MILSDNGTWGYIHLPKCGGTWVRKQLVDVLQVGTVLDGPQGHNWPETDPDDVADDLRRRMCSHGALVINPGRGGTETYMPKLVTQDRMWIASVRKPSEWYLSYWKFRTKLGFVGQTLSLDEARYKGQHTKFEWWVDWCLDNEPGYLDRLMWLMLGGVGGVHLWRIESLSAGLGHYLDLDPRLFSQGRENVSESEQTMSNATARKLDSSNPKAYQLWESAWHEDVLN